MTGTREAAAPRSTVRVVRDARRALHALARPSGEFDAQRYFRGDNGGLRFLNVGTPRVRALARTICERETGWSVSAAMAFADELIRDPELEAKGLAVEVVARHRRDFKPALLPAWRRWLVGGFASNWATTDSISGSLIGPLLVTHPALARQVRTWVRHPSLWVRRSAVVSLIPSVRRGAQLDLAYATARALHADQADLMQKAVGWLLREAGKQDPERLEQYLLAHGPLIPRTTLRYAIERFPPSRRRELLDRTAGRRT